MSRRTNSQLREKELQLAVDGHRMKTLIPEVEGRNREVRQRRKIQARASAQAAPITYERVVRYAPIRFRRHCKHSTSECPVAKVIEVSSDLLGRYAVVEDDLGNNYKIREGDCVDFREEKGQAAFDRSRKIPIKLKEGDEVVLPKKGDFSKSYFGTLPDFLSLNFNTIEKRVTVPVNG